MSRLLSAPRPRAWLELAVVAASCVLWWAFARSEELAMALFGSEAERAFYELDYAFERVLAVWTLGVGLAAGLLTGAVVLRRIPAPPGSPQGWIYVAVSFAVLGAAILTARAATRRPLLDANAAVSLATGAALLGALEVRATANARRRTAGRIEPDRGTTAR
jgi:hypothetical protein